MPNLETFECLSVTLKICFCRNNLITLANSLHFGSTLNTCTFSVALLNINYSVSLTYRKTVQLMDLAQGLQVELCLGSPSNTQMDFAYS